MASLRRWLTLLVWLLGLVSVAACTTTAYRPELLQAPPASPAVIAVGPIQAKDDALWHGYATLERRGLLEQLGKLRGPGHVMDLPPGAPVPAESLLVSGELTEFDKGNIALRWIIGFGAGRSRAVSALQLQDPNAAVLMRFTITKEYAGGAGIGGADLIDADTLARQLGEKAADAIDSWLRTGKLPQ